MELPGAKVLTAAWRTVQCTAKPRGVAANAAAEVSAETAALIAGSNEDLVSYRARQHSTLHSLPSDIDPRFVPALELYPRPGGH